MADVHFNDQELGFISMALGKVDPTGIVAEAVAIQAKIRAYAMEKQQQQAQEAAAVVDAGEG